MKHTHHIIPRHMGGSDDRSNLIELTIEEHAEAHRILYEQYGHWQDKVAWKGLLGLIGYEDIMQEMYNARKGTGNVMYGKPCFYKMTEEEKARWKSNLSKSGKGKKKPDGFSEKCKERVSGKNNPMYGKDPWNKGKVGLQKQANNQLLKKSKPLIFEDKIYISLNAAEKETGMSSYKISKVCQFISAEEYMKATSK